MFYAITVLLIISILSLLLVLLHLKKKQKYIQELEESLKILRDQLSEREQSPDDQLRSLKQKIQHARKMLIPSQLWKSGKAIEDISYIQGKVDTLDWLEQNHAKTPINIRHTR